jgi:hypothetical protein
VSETTAEIITEMAIVRANWLYSLPVRPGMKATGTNRAASTRVVAMTGPATSVTASRDASRGAMPSSIRRSVFSTTMMASSTTSPTASTMPRRLKVLNENPSSAIGPKVPTSATGTAMAGIRVARQFCRKR